MLRLVHPAPQGKEKRTRNLRRLPSRSPTAEEQQRIHAALRNIARAYGGCDVLAEVMGVSESTLHHRQTRSYGFAFLLARAAGIPVEQLLSGQPHVVGACALCGRKRAR